MEMDTNTGGGIGKLFGRAFSGESLFRCTYTARQGEGMISFASSMPGRVLPIEISPQRAIVAQKSAFLATEAGVDMNIFFQKKLGSGFFGGEGFIMQKFEGEGVLFVELDGSTVEYELQAGEQLVLDTGHLAIMDGTCNMDIQTVKGAKNIFFGGEGLFNTVVTGPGKVVVQTLPVNKLALELYRYMPKSGGNG